MKVWVGGLLIVFGMVAIVKLPWLGVPMIGVGGWILVRASPEERGRASNTFLGLCMLCGAILGAMTIISWIFG